MLPTVSVIFKTRPRSSDASTFATQIFFSIFAAGTVLTVALAVNLRVLIMRKNKVGSRKRKAADSVDKENVKIELTVENAGDNENNTVKIFKGAQVKHNKKKKESTKSKQETEYFPEKRNLV